MGDYTLLKKLRADLKLTERRRRPEIHFRFHCEPEDFKQWRLLIPPFLTQLGWYALQYGDPAGVLYCYLARDSGTIQSFKSYVSAYGMYPNAVPSKLYIGVKPPSEPCTPPLPPS